MVEQKMSREEIKKRFTMEKFHGVMQKVGTVQKTLKNDPEYRKWYKKYYPNSPYAKRNK